MLKPFVVSILAAQAAALRYVMYIDQYVGEKKTKHRSGIDSVNHCQHRYHIANLPGTDQTQGITHAIMAFAPSTTFTSGSQFTPFEAVSQFKSRFPSDTKIMIALGGWGDTAGFSAGAKDNATIQTYAKNVAAMLDSVGADGVGKTVLHASLPLTISLLTSVV